MSLPRGQAKYSGNAQQRPLTTASQHDHQHTELAGTTAKRPAAPLVRDEEAVPAACPIGRSAPGNPRSLPGIPKMSIGEHAGRPAAQTGLLSSGSRSSSCFPLRSGAQDGCGDPSGESARVRSQWEDQLFTGKGRGSMGWAQATTLIVAVITGAGAVVAAAVTYGLTQRAGRRERQAKAFAEALATIEEYANMPYRIRRRPPEARHEISVELTRSSPGSPFSMPGSRGAPQVAAAYDRLVRAARSEAGEDMQEGLDSATALVG